MAKPNDSEIGQDPALKDTVAEAEAAEPTLDEMHRARIDDYQHEILHNDDSLVASVGGIQAGLMRNTRKYEQLISKAMGAVRDLVELMALEPAMRTYLNLTRQVDRFANLEMRHKELKSQAQQGSATRAVPPR